MNKKQPNPETNNKLGPNKYIWAYNIQSKPFPSWIEAFDYAYQLGYNNCKRDNEFLEAAKETMERHSDLLKRLQD